MILNRIKMMAGAALVAEADDLEARFGPAGAVDHIREQIAQARRENRQHLYRLHDEIARRRASVSAA